MRRRELITLLGGAATSMILPISDLCAQQPAMTQIGVVTIQPSTSPPFAAFTQRLHQLGYIEGQNLRLDFINPERQAGGNAGVVQELIRRKVDIILANYQSTMAAAVAAASSKPIVMIAVDYDPVALGYVKSLARRCCSLALAICCDRRQDVLMLELEPDLASSDHIVPAFNAETSLSYGREPRHRYRYPVGRRHLHNVMGAWRSRWSVSCG